MESYRETLNLFIKEFKNQMSFETLIKLRVLTWHLAGNSPKQIKQKLNKLYIKKQGSQKSKYIAPYLRSDNKKISRISKCDDVVKLPKFIGISEIVEIIVKKYPFPPFPLKSGEDNYCWDENGMDEYIRRYFSIPTDCNFCSKETIKNSLLKLHVTHYDLSSVLKYYLTSSKTYDFYYLSTNIYDYPVSVENAKNEPSRQYNRTIFLILFKLGDIQTYVVKQKSFNKNINELGVYDYIEEWEKNIKKIDSPLFGENPVFILQLWNCIDYSDISSRTITLCEEDEIVSKLKKIENKTDKKILKDRISALCQQLDTIMKFERSEDCSNKEEAVTLLKSALNNLKF